ncbi:hypothetical protein Cfor_05944, partial [Coptotermes formosanus]
WRPNRPYHSRRKAVTAATCRTLLCNHIRLFGEETSLHGFRYIISPKSRLAEKLLWSAVCITCVSVAIVMMDIVWLRFQDSPTVTTVETTTYPIWNIPFPAVTLCNNNKVHKTAAIALAKHLSERLPVKNSTVLEVLAMLPALINFQEINDQEARKFQEVLLGAGYNISDLMLQLTPPCKTLLLKCIWLDTVTDCSDLFHVSKSVMGICCSFNYYGVKDNLRPVQRDQEGHIHYAHGAGQHAGLTVVLDTQQPEYFAPLDPMIGIWAMFHDPEDYPDTDLQTALVEPGKSVTVMLEAQVIESTDTVRWMNVESRQCWFDDEVAVLQSSPSYSFQTCITECRMKVFQEKCGCIPFFYPLFGQYLSLNSFGRNLMHNETEGMNCTCQPQCTDKSYLFDRETAVSEPRYSRTESVLRNVANASVLHAFFRGITCMKYARNAYVTWDVVFDVQQTKEIYNYQNTKKRLRKTNAAIWFNKICKPELLTEQISNV